MKTIRVLMSTYNGERFLKEQIDSVLRQQGVNVSLYVRDDGSTDGTIHILDEYSLKYKNIKVFPERNAGCADSFFKLMQLAYDKDILYYAFCDQDDVWEEDKLFTAIQNLSLYDEKAPNMYCSNLWVTDEYLNPIRKMYHSDTVPGKVGALVENIATGCTVVINGAAASFILNTPLPKTPIMHDWWVYKICAFFGNVIFDATPHIKYRQHMQNVLGAKKKSVFKLYVNFLTSIFERDKNQYRCESAGEFLGTYRELLSDTDIRLIQVLTEYKVSCLKKMRLFFSKDVRMKENSTNIRFKIRVLFGLI